MDYMSFSLLPCRVIYSFVLPFRSGYDASFFPSAACRSVLCIQRKHGGISRCNIDAKEDFGRPNYDIRLHTQHRLSRYAVGRSGLTEAGTAGADYPLPGFSNYCYSVVTSFC